MPHPGSSDYPDLLDVIYGTGVARVDGVTIVHDYDHNFTNLQVRRLQEYVGLTGDLIGENVAGKGPGGIVSAVPDGGNAIDLAARAPYTAGNLLRVGDNFDVGFIPKFIVADDGSLWSNAGLQLQASTIVTDILDEDTMVSDRDDALATQQSIKAYVDAAAGGGVLVRSIVVGNSTEGDAAADCDFLDVGNGAQLAAAIAAAAGNNDDVYIRPGTYDFNLPGGPAGPITIPNSTAIRGAGMDHTIIIPVIDDPRAFLFGFFGCLEDLRVQCPDDVTGALFQTVPGCVIELAYNSVCRNVWIEFINDWQMWAPMGVLVYDAFGIPPTVVGGIANLINCQVTGTKTNALMGGAPCSSYANQGAAISYLSLENCVSAGGDRGLYSNLAGNVVSVRHSSFLSPLATTICDISGDTSSIIGCKFVQNGMFGSPVVILSGQRINFTNNYIEATFGGGGTRAIILNFVTGCVVSGNYGPGDTIGGAGVQAAVDSPAGSDYNIVTGNNFFDVGSVVPCNYNDAGIGNVYANNL